MTCSRLCVDNIEPIKVTNMQLTRNDWRIVIPVFFHNRATHCWDNFVGCLIVPSLLGGSGRRKTE